MSNPLVITGQGEFTREIREEDVCPHQSQKQYSSSGSEATAVITTSSNKTLALIEELCDRLILEGGMIKVEYSCHKPIVARLVTTFFADGRIEMENDLIPGRDIPEESKQCYRTLVSVAEYAIQSHMQGKGD